MDQREIARLINAEARSFLAAGHRHGQHVLIVGARAYRVPRLRLGRRTLDRVSADDVGSGMAWPWIRCNCLTCWPTFRDDVGYANGCIILTDATRAHLRSELRAHTAAEIRREGWL